MQWGGRLVKKMKNERFGSRHGKVEEILNVHKLLTHHVIYTLVWLTCAAVLGGIIFRMARYLWSHREKNITQREVRFW